jgi:hypothetical protein
MSKTKREKFPSGWNFRNGARRNSYGSEFSKRSAKNFLRAGIFKTKREEFPASRNFRNEAAQYFLRAGTFQKQRELGPSVSSGNARDHRLAQRR